MKPTMSLCPICYKEIPAFIYSKSKVVMMKKCQEHGIFTSVVERSIHWYEYCQALNSNAIYDGYLIDVTSKCNLQCKYCYHDNNGKERSIKDILWQAEQHKELAPFILTGGEPTLHSELPEIVKGLSEFGKVNLLTNGIRFCDASYRDAILPLLKYESGVTSISLSFHKEANGKDIEFLDYCKENNIVIWTVFYVIDALSQIDEAINLFKQYSTCVHDFRIKAASTLWNTQNVQDKIFVSDMLKYLDGAVLQNSNQMISYAQVFYEELDIKLVSWYDIGNVDLWDINCAPYYRANDGSINNLVTSCLLNERPNI